jgi:hypothetical protein
MQAPRWPTRGKKARPRQVPLKFLSCFLFSMVKILTGALLFSHACMWRELSFFPVFSFGVMANKTLKGTTWDSPFVSGVFSPGECGD